MVSIYKTRDFSGFEVWYKSKGVYEKGEILDWICEQKDARNWCEDWLSRDEKNGLANAVYGEVLVDLAWSIRGGGVASTVSDAQALGFSETLMEAENYLFRAIEADPSKPFAYFRLINVAIGLGDDELARSAYEKGSREAAGTYHLFYAMTVYLTPKWHGSTEELFSFCRDASEKDDTGILLGLVPYAHFEQRMYLAMNDEFSKYDAYFFDSEIKKEVEDSFQKLLTYELSSAHLFSLNVFAKIFIEMKDYENAKKVFSIIGNRPIKVPWMYDGNDYVDAFLKSKQRLGLSLV